MPTFVGTAGDDLFAWKLGDGPAQVDGGAGADVQNITAGSAADAINLSASADHLVVTVRGAQAVDMVGVETLNLKPLAGADAVNVGDLSATAVRTVNIDLNGPAGSADNAADTVSLTGLAGDNDVVVSLAAGGRGLTVTDAAGGVTETTGISGLDARDQVSLAFGSGADHVTIAGPTSKAHLFVDLGGGNDTAQAAAGAEEIHGGDGADMLAGANGTILEGDAGNDTLVGASNDVIFGGDGADVLVAGDSTRAFGEAGDDVFTLAAGRNGAQLSGGDGDDTFFAANGNNELHGDAGADSFTLVMSARDGSNTLFDGGDGADTLRIVAARDGVGARIAISNVDGLADAHVVRDDDDGDHIPTDAHLFIQGVEHLILQAGSGADTIDVADLTGLGVRQIDIDLGRDGSADIVNLAAPSDAEVAFTRSADGTSEQVTYAVNGAVVETINIAGLDAGDVVNLSGGATRDVIGTDQADIIDVGDPTLQGVSTVNVDLAGTDGAPDGALDTVNLVAPANAQVVRQLGEDGTSQQVTFTIDGAVVETINIRGADAADVVNVTGSAQEPTVTGTSHSDTFNWTLGDPRQLFDGAGGIDTLNLTGGPGVDRWPLFDPGGVNNLVDFRNIEIFNISLGAGNDDFGDFLSGANHTVRVDAGTGDDQLNTGNGVDVLIGGSGNDTLNGFTIGNGNDSLSGGDGDDLFTRFNADGVGDGTLTLDGGRGFDTLMFGSAIDRQSLVLAPSADGFTLTLNGAVEAKVAGMESLQIQAAAHIDFVRIGDLVGSGVQEVDLNLAGGGRQEPDLIEDTVFLTTSAKGEHLTATTVLDGTVVVSGMSEKLVISNYDIGKDLLFFQAGSGSDTIDASLQDMQTELEGGGGADSLAGGFGTDGLAGGAGSDTLMGGQGDDSFIFFAGETGTDVILDFHTHQNGTSLHGDIIGLRGFADQSVLDLINHHHLLQVGNDVAITDGIHTVAIIRNMAVGELGGADFFFTT